MSRQYFQYLCDIIDGSNYYNMLWLLHNVEYKCVVSGDNNRISDAMLLRDTYGNHGMTKNPTVLEVLVSLSQRCEKDIMHDDAIGDRTSHWFWLMMHNVGLDDKNYSDDFWCDARVGRVNDKIFVLNERKYNKDGTNGGLFPLKSTKRDLRRVELWYQLNWYLLENYEYEFM